MNPISTEPLQSSESQTDWLEVARQKVQNLRFGSIQITVHEGQVTQIESVEKTRFPTQKGNLSQVK